MTAVEPVAPLPPAPAEQRCVSCGGYGTARPCRYCPVPQGEPVTPLPDERYGAFKDWYANAPTRRRGRFSAFEAGIAFAKREVAAPLPSTDAAWPVTLEECRADYQTKVLLVATMPQNLNYKRDADEAFSRLSRAITATAMAEAQVDGLSATDYKEAMEQGLDMARDIGEDLLRAQTQLAEAQERIEGLVREVKRDHTLRHGLSYEWDSCTMDLCQSVRALLAPVEEKP